MIEKYSRKEKNRGRIEKRTLKIYKNHLNEFNKEKWKSVNSIIEVERVVKIKDKTTKEIAYFISDLKPETGAKYFFESIRLHWQIESFHYIKDTTFLEDAWKVKTKNAPANYSIIRNLAINIFRHRGLNCIQEAIEKCANNVGFMMSLF